MSAKQDKVIHEQFIIALKKKGLTVKTANQLSSIGDDDNISAVIRMLGANNRNIYFIICQGKIGIVQLHIRAEGSGFWGLTKRIIDDAKTFKDILKIPNWLVLLLGRQDKFIADGYVIPEIGKSPMKRQITLLANGCYKINEIPDLNIAEKIRSIEIIASKIRELLLK
jgi:hypothetical protein